MSKDGYGKQVMQSELRIIDCMPDREKPYFPSASIKFRILLVSADN